MYHSITFGDKNTWTDWHLVPASRPVINPPKPKTQYVDIPGADGSIDLTESLAGRPVFSDREGSIEFYVLNDYDLGVEEYSWIEVYSSIMQYLHGRSMKMVLEDDPNYFYEGRFTVNSWKSDANHSTITIDYVVGPYKYLVSPSVGSISAGDISVSDGQDTDSYAEYYARTVNLVSYHEGDSISVDGFKLNYFRYDNANASSYSGGKHDNMVLYKGGKFIVPSKGYYRFSFAKGDGTAMTYEDIQTLKSSIVIYKGGSL